MKKPKHCLESAMAILYALQRLLARGKNKPQFVTALGRELLGFIWAIAIKVEARAGINNVRLT